jgi:alkylation response protein AidB-like acyl-CoA dehydrogenase
MMNSAGAASTARLIATCTGLKITTDAFRVRGWSGHTKDYRVKTK